MKKIDLKIKEIEEKCKQIRRYSMEMGLAASDGAHIGPAFSIVEILGALYFDAMNFDPKNPTWEDRDRFLLSKGHATLSYYAALAMAGFFPVEDLMKFETRDSFLHGHPSMNLQ